MRGLNTIILLLFSNSFMTIAWYGHLKLKTISRFENISLLAVILLSWGIAFFEYSLQVPANRIGFKENGGPFSLIELKVIQEVIRIHDLHTYCLQDRAFQNEPPAWFLLSDPGSLLCVQAIDLILPARNCNIPGCL